MTIDELDLIKRQYGELCVDDCFKAAARIIASTVRDVDMPARIQDNRIAIIFPETYSSHATTIGERICQRVKQEPISEQLRFLRVTASCGIVSFPAHARDEIDLMNKAKEFLATAQSAGGNSVYNG
jgi:diguanylate cyclase (GGDEF)-like protein